MSERFPRGTTADIPGADAWKPFTSWDRNFPRYSELTASPSEESVRIAAALERIADAMESMNAHRTAVDLEVEMRAFDRKGRHGRA